MLKRYIKIWFHNFRLNKLTFLAFASTINTWLSTFELSQHGALYWSKRLYFICSTCDVHYVCAQFDLISVSFDMCTERILSENNFWGKRVFHLNCWQVFGSEVIRRSKKKGDKNLMLGFIFYTLLVMKIFVCLVLFLRSFPENIFSNFLGRISKEF